MKRIIGTVLTTLSTSVLLFAQSDSVTLIEDFETTSLRNQNYISEYSDNSDGGNSQMNVSYSEEESRFVTFTYELDRGDYEWDPYVNLALSNQGGFDGADYEGIRYRYRGDAHTVQLELYRINDWCFHEAEVAQSDEWRTINISFERDVRQPQWGNTVPFDPSNIRTLSWRVLGETGETGSVSIDHVEFVKSMPYQKLFDMEILPAEIPERIAVGEWSNESVVHQRVQKYLSRGVCLHNWLEEDEPWDGVFEYDREMIKKYSEQGFNALRFPIDLDRWVVDRDEVAAGTKEFTIDSTLFEILDSMEIWTGLYGLSFTIDYHQYDKSLSIRTVGDEGYRKMVAQLWKSVAHYYNANEREDIFFELTNEPGIMDDIPNSAWREMAQEMLDSIRSVNEFHSVLYGESRWYDRDKLISNELFAPEDTNLIYVFHYYDPFVFTHQGASWAGSNSTGNVPFPYSEERWSTELRDFGVSDGTEEWIKQSFLDYYQNGNANKMFNDVAEVKNWAITNNVPVVCNELGVYEKSSQVQDRINWFTTIGDIFTELEMGYGIWFGQFDENEDLIPGVAEPLGLKE